MCCAWTRSLTMAARLTQGLHGRGCVRAWTRSLTVAARLTQGAAWEGVCACMDTFPDSGRTADPGHCMGGGVCVHGHVP